MSRSVLVADDDPALLEMMRLALVKEGFRVSAAASTAAARGLLADRAFDLVVSDIYLGDGTGIELLDDVRAANPDAVVILVTAQGTVETAAAAHHAGVSDYLAKPFRVEDLVKSVRAALASTASDEDAAPPTGPETMIIGSHPKIVEVYKAVARVAPTQVPVLVRGETGTGKELVARALHRYGRTPGGPMVAINCGAIPSGLLESELFGHRRGAFTGADRDHRGAVEAADGGTLFLDEVGELAPDLQITLLRFLQDGEIRPVGADSPVSVQARVVAATHRDPGREIEAGHLREDFYYRLAGYEIELPPLRERTSDLPLLVEHFRGRIQRELGADRLPSPDEATLEVLRRHPWPGNVRELETVVRRAAIDLGTLADPEGVRAVLRRVSPGEGDDAGRPPGVGDDLTLEELERRHIEAVLARCGGNRTRGAEILGIERKTLYRKAERLGIDLDGKGGGDG